MSESQYMLLLVQGDEVEHQIEQALDHMEAIYQRGHYPKLQVRRPWSRHNPHIDGEFAQPSAMRWYLKRELTYLVQKNAEIRISAERPILALNDPRLLDIIDEDRWDFRQKKLFLFQAERMQLSFNRLEHYTGTRPEDFQRYIALTNYQFHVESFLKKFPDCVKPDREHVQMPAYHYRLPDNKGVTLVNIGVGPANAKTLTDHVAVMRPDAMLMVGHCAGLRNHQEIGDFVLATGYLRADGVLDDLVPPVVPIIPNLTLNLLLKQELEQRNLTYRIGTVYTTGNRNWEFSVERTRRDMNMSRSVACDMESATVATNGFRYRIPNATLLCVSDKPLHGRPKLSGPAQAFYQDSKEKHLEIALDAFEACRNDFPYGLPNDSMRSLDEPVLGNHTAL